MGGNCSTESTESVNIKTTPYKFEGIPKEKIAQRNCPPSPPPPPHSGKSKLHEHAHAAPGTIFMPPASQPIEIELKDVKARVDKINIEGLARTKDDIVKDAVHELFSARDFEDVIQKIHKVKNRLDTLGLFNSIGIYLDVSKDSKCRTPNGLEVTFLVREMKRIAGGVHTEVGNNEGALVVSLMGPNLFGRGERVQMQYSYGSKRTNNFNLSYTKPFMGKGEKVLTTSLYQMFSEAPASGYKVTEQGLLFDFGIFSYGKLRHNFQYDAAIREMGVLTRTSSMEARENAGYTLKSAVRHILSLDFRDDPIFPNCGSFFNLKTELAGLGGSIGFFKNELFSQLNVPLFKDIVFQAGLSLGHISALSDEKTYGIVDNFFLGGPMNLRGFEHRGVGPHSDGNSLGSDVYWAAGLHLFSPLPFRPGKGGLGDNFRTHCFANFGNIESTENASQLLENIRISFGLGIAMKLGKIARLELNYCFPFAYQQGDELNSGVQFGIGVQFV